jgi:alpha-1,2-rhamnosyltransferase
VAHANAINLDQFARLDGSILVLLDASWSYPIWPAVERFHRGGGRVVGVLYDLIPLTYPHTSTPEHVAAFGGWLRQHARHSDAFIGISRSVAAEIRAFLAGLTDGGRVSRRPNVDHFLLGSELDLFHAGASVRPVVAGIFGKAQNAFLMVGSIEPRKNHQFVLDAFDRFWAQGGTATLVLIGGHGWDNKRLLRRIAQHPRLDQQLFLLRDAIDAELEFAYRNAAALIIASEAEGFGLPIVEAFQHGLPVLCSDIPVFREIADGKATFFNLSESRNLTEALVAFCQQHDARRREARTPQSWYTWSESTDQLCAAVFRVLALPAEPVAPTGGAR